MNRKGNTYEKRGSKIRHIDIPLNYEEVAENDEQRAVRRKEHSLPFSGSNFDKAFFKPFTPDISKEYKNQLVMKMEIDTLTEKRRL